MKLRIRKRTVWRVESGRPSRRSMTKLAVLGRRSTATFFVALILFLAAQLTGYMWLDHRAEKQAIQRSELLPNTKSKASPVTLNPDYKDPRVKSVEDAIGAPPPKKEEDKSPKISAVTEAAKSTALTKDPVKEYFKEREANGNKPKTLTNQEIKNKRTADSYTYRNNEGGETQRMYASPVNYKKNGNWEPIAGTLKDDASYNQKVGFKASILDQFVSKEKRVKRGFRQDDGLLKLGFRPLHEKDDTITIGVDGAPQLSIKPIGASDSSPTLQTAGDGTKYVEYKDAWKNTDLYYEQRGSALKEYISLKSMDVPGEFGFTVAGAKLTFGKGTDGKKDGTVVATFPDGTQATMPALTLSSMKTGPVSSPPLSYKLQGNKVSVAIDKTWIEKQPAANFPLVIDPTYAYYTYYHTGVPGGDLGQFIAYKSDGYVCNSSNCDMYVGSLNDRGLKSWRTEVHMPFTDVYGKTVSSASIYTERVNRPYTWSGFEGNRTYWATWANCFGYNCRSGAPQAAGNIDWGGYLDATGLMQWVSQNNVGDGWLMMWGNEGDIQSFKSFSGANTFLDVAYYNVAQNRRTDLPTLSVPAQSATVMVNRPTLKMNPVSDPDGDLVKYSFHLMDSRNNVVAYAGELDAPSWTIPDGLMTDGETYNWRGFVMERNASNPSIVESGWRQTNETRSFKFNLRAGKDVTQTYDEVGPFSINMNTGNVYGSFPTHTISSQGGDIGLGLDYNTPYLVRQGLMAKYYNNTTGTGQPAITVQDPNIDMNWGTSSPYPGAVQADNFMVTWTGFFKAPQDGTYTFGATRDDKISMGMKTTSSATQYTPMFDYGCCGTTWATPTSVTLIKGQSYGITVTATEFTGAASAQLLVRTPDNVEQVVPSEWLAYSGTTPDSMISRYYKNNDPVANPNFVINDTTPLVFSSTVQTISKDWGTNSLVPADPAGQYADNMIVNYSGYITFPYTGDYKLGGSSDDGLKIRLGGQQVMSQTNGTHWSSLMHFNAGETVSLQVDYYEATGSANLNLQWQGPGSSGTIPAQYMTAAPRSVPIGWTLSADPDGNIPYEVLTTNSDGSVQLIDSTGFTHVYTWNEAAKAYKPPVNEDGYLVKNDDSSYTLTDVDGRVYNFAPQGVITSVTSPNDDKNPAGLKYEYKSGATSTFATQPKLYKVIDGIDPSRYGQVYYYGEPESNGVCVFATPPFGASATPPPGAICAFKTFPDNRVTQVQYSNKSLWQIVQPGDAKTSFKYSGAQQVSMVLDAEDNDAVAAGLASSTYVGTGLSYDVLSRAWRVEAGPPSGSGTPSSPGQGNAAQQHSYEYGFQNTKRHVTNATETNGYTQYIEYDNLLRTTKACDNVALCTTTQWDPVKDLELSSTDPAGMKTTTIYDEDDRPTDQYGAAPAAWFGTDRKPLPAYVSQTPKTQTKYDEGMTGPAVAWYGARGQSLFGAPKVHSTGIDANSVNHIGRDFQPTGSVPVTTDVTTPGYGFSATGKIAFPQAGLYTFKVNHDDGVRLYVNDVLIVDDWTARTAGAAQASPEGTFNAEAGKSYRIRLDYIHFDDGAGAGIVDTWLRGPGITDISGTDLGTNQFGNLITPSYGLVTTRSASDNSVGDAVVKTTYTGDPAYGLVGSTVIDPTGLNYTNQATYEPQGTGYARQLTKTSAGGSTTNYQYYGATEATDNPCTPTADPASQAGRVKLRIDPDPDGAGPQTARVVEVIYNNSGQEVANRANQDAWTCTEFDTRGRISKITTPAAMDGATVVRAGKMVTTNYAYGGNPLVTTTQDETGLFTLEERDLADRIIRKVDLNGDTTTTLYDTLNRPTQKTSIVGVEAFTYDSYGRPTSYGVDNVIYATMTYDQYGRMQTVTYPEAKDASGNKLKLDQLKFDTLQRGSGSIFKFSDNTTFEETVNRSMSGMVLSTVNNLRGTQATNTYSYDRATRLTEAIVDNMKYTYDFSAPNAAVCNQSSANLNAHKNANRTGYTATNLTTSQVMASSSHCYDKADRLIGSTDTQVGIPTYDDHGNIVSLAGGGTPITFTYNNVDQNTKITQGNNRVEYVRTVDDAILRKKEYQNNVLTKSYRYADSGRVLQTCSLTDDNACATADKYLTLPGGVTITLSPNNPDTTKRTVYSIKNFHGDTALTVGANGLPTSSVFLYEPFGQDSPSQTFGTNSQPGNSSNESMGWAANPMRKQESLFSLPIVQMGARTYLPTLGRFLQVDPMEGGAPNAYAYVGDPINSNDYSGNFAWLLVIPIVMLIIRIAPIIIRVVPIIIRAIPAIISAVKAVVTLARTPAGAATAKAAASAANASKAAGAARAAGGVGSSGAKAVSAAGRASEGYKGINVISQAPKSPGVYQFNQANGQVYTGMTTRPIATRLQEHVASGKLIQGAPVRTMDMTGASRLQIRVQEQTWMNQAGGAGSSSTGNMINSVSPKYWDGLGIPPF